MSDKMRWCVSCDVEYDEEVESADEAVFLTVEYLKDALKNIGKKNANDIVFMVTDYHTNGVCVTTANISLSSFGEYRNIINIDQSVNYSPSIVVNVDKIKKKKDSK